jgi:hypothetical protein
VVSGEHRVRIRRRWPVAGLDGTRTRPGREAADECDDRDEADDAEHVPDPAAPPLGHAARVDRAATGVEGL